MNQLENTIMIFIKRRPMTKDEVCNELKGICERPQVMHALEEMVHYGLIYYDRDGKINPVE